MHKEYEGYLIELDWKMYNGKEKIEEALDFINRLRKIDKLFLFLTNNSTANPETVTNKLKKVSDVKAYAKEVFTSTEATITYLHKMKARRIYVIGEAGLLEGLRAEDLN